MVNLLGTEVSYNRDTYSPTTDPNVQGFLTALAKKESGGQKDPYTAVSSYTTKSGMHAYGKYQIEGSNIPSWTKQYLGTSMTISQFLADPQAQDELMSKRAQQLYGQYGNWADVASVHFSGRPLKQAGNAADSSGETVPAYVKAIMSFLGGGVASADTMSDMAASGIAPTATPSQMSVSDFAAKIKAKYPQYASMDDQTLTQKIIAKYPQYASQVNMGSTDSPGGASPDPGTVPSPIMYNAQGQITNGPTPPGQAAPSGGNVVTNAIKGTASAMGGMFKDDFTSMGNLFQNLGSMYRSSAMTGQMPSYPGGASQAWSDIGGSVGALSDVAMGAGMIVGDVAQPESAAANPAEVAADVAARGAIKTELQKTVGRFAAGKGGGLAAQGASSAASTFSKAKGQGASTAKAAAEAAFSGATTLATFGLMNKFGPSVANKFTQFVSGLKIGDYVGGMLNKVTETLSAAAQGGAMKTTADYAKTALNSAASGVIKLNSTVFHSMADNLEAPTNKEVDAMVGRISSDVTSGGNQAVEQTFTTAKAGLAPFAAKVGDISKIVGGMLQGAGGVVERGSEEAKAAMKALAGSDQMNLTEALQTTIAGMKKDATVPIADLLDVINAPSKSVQDSQIKSAVWDAIRSAVGDDPKGLAALDDYAHAQATRAAQTFNSGLMDSVRAATANPEALLQKGQQASQSTWQNFVTSVWGHLDTQSDVDQLKAALGGTQYGMKQFGQMLTKKILYDGMSAYQRAAGSITYATPETAKAASDAFQATVEKYTSKLTSLPGLVDPETTHFLQDMAHGIPDVATIAKNAGVEVPGLTDVEAAGLKGLTLSKDELQAVSESPIGKFLAKGVADVRSMPDALLKSSPDALSALKKAMDAQDPKQWEMMGAMTIGRIMTKVTGLWGETDAKDIEDTLASIQAKAGGDKQVFETIFGKKEGDSIINNLVKYGQAVEDNKTLWGGKIKRSASKAVQASVFALIHHYYIASVLIGKSFNELASDSENTFLKDLAAKSASGLDAEFTKAAGEVGGVRGFLAKITNALNNSLVPIFKYEVGNKLPQQLVPAATDALLGGQSDGSSSEGQ